LAKKKYEGKVYSKLTITRVVPLGECPDRGGRSRERRLANVKCECGIEKTILMSHVTSGKVKSCGCGVLIAAKKLSDKTLSLVGTKIKGVEILSVSKYKTKSYYECRCICGKIYKNNCYKTQSGNIGSCGCRSYRWGSSFKSDRVFYAQYKYAAKLRDLDFAITKEEFSVITKKLCVYCGGKNSGSHNGLDRVNNYKGYVTGNIVSCCSICNRAKHKMPLTEFLSWRNNFSKNILTEEAVLEIANDY
jgi:hypothetical protein